jgi:hypothetical protein
MNNQSFAIAVITMLSMSGQALAQTAGCVATADLPSSILGSHDTIRVTHQQAATAELEVDNSRIRVVDSDGNLLGQEYPFTLGVNESKTFSVEEICQLTNLTFAQKRLPNKVVQIVELTEPPNPHNYQATYRNGIGMLTPLLFTCDGFKYN